MTDQHKDLIPDRGAEMPRVNVDIEEQGSHLSEHVNYEQLKEEATFPSERGMSKFTLYKRRFVRNRGAVAGLIIFIGLVLFAIFGPIISPWDYTDPDFLSLSQPPSSRHWFGTDGTGVDLFAQVAHGLGRSLMIAVTVSFLTTAISAIVGGVAGYFGGKVEKVTLMVIHFIMAVPSFLLLALLVGTSGGDWKWLIFGLVVLGWIGSARLIWSMSLSIRDREYVTAAQFMGVGRLKIVIRHVLPNISSIIILGFTFGVISTVMSETSLSFLGLGVQLPDCSLGTLLSDGVASIQGSPWRFAFPTIVLTLLTTSMALITDGLRDALDPHSAAGGKA